MEEKGYNGYTNYETWLLCLNIDNEEGLQNEFHKFKGTKEELKNQLEDMFKVENGFKICDFWSNREWELIDWNEVLTTRQEE